jgi:hypothetical protein
MVAFLDSFIPKMRTKCQKQHQETISNTFWELSLAEPGPEE